MNNDYLTTSQALELIKARRGKVFSRTRLNTLIKVTPPRIKAVKRGRDWFIKRADLEAFLAEPPRPVGRRKSPSVPPDLI